MPIVATITRLTSASFFTQPRSPASPNAGGSSFIANKIGGGRIGFFQTPGAALAACKRSFGANVIAKMERNTSSAVEQYNVIGLPFDPFEIYSDQGLFWVEPLKLITVARDPATLRAGYCGDQMRKGNPATQGGGALVEPVLDVADTHYNGHPSFAFTAREYFLVPTVTSLAPPYVVTFAAFSGAGGVAWYINDGGGGNATLISSNPGNWRFGYAAHTINGAAPSTTHCDIITAIVATTEQILRVNGVEQGSIVATTPATGTIDIGGGASGSAFDGTIGSVHVAIPRTGLAPSDAEWIAATKTPILQAERYLQKTFQPSGVAFF